MDAEHSMALPLSVTQLSLCEKHWCSVSVFPKLLLCIGYCVKVMPTFVSVPEDFCRSYLLNLEGLDCGACIS